MKKFSIVLVFALMMELVVSGFDTSNNAPKSNSTEDQTQIGIMPKDYDPQKIADQGSNNQLAYSAAAQEKQTQIGITPRDYDIQKN